MEAIGSALLGGLLVLAGQYVAQRSARSNERSRVKRERLERAWLVGEEVKSWASRKWMWCVRNELGVAGPVDTDAPPIAELNMLIGLYLPALRAGLKGLDDRCRTFSRTVLDRESKALGAGDAALEPGKTPDATYQELRDEVERFLQALETEAAKHL